MTVNFNSKRHSKYLIHTFVYVITQALASLVLGFILGNIMLVIIVLLALIPNFDLMTGIAISSVQLVTITCLGIWSTIASISLINLAWDMLIILKGRMNRSDTQ